MILERQLREVNIDDEGIGGEAEPSTKYCMYVFAVDVRSESCTLP